MQPRRTPCQSGKDENSQTSGLPSPTLPLSRGAPRDRPRPPDPPPTVGLGPVSANLSLPTRRPAGLALSGSQGQSLSARTGRLSPPGSGARPCHLGTRGDTLSTVAGAGNAGCAVAWRRDSCLRPVASAPSPHLWPAAPRGRAHWVQGPQLQPGLGAPRRGGRPAASRLLPVSEPARSAGRWAVPSASFLSFWPSDLPRGVSTALCHVSGGAASQEGWPQGGDGLEQGGDQADLGCSLQQTQAATRGLCQGCEARCRLG